MSSFCKATHIFFSKKFQHTCICISLHVNVNKSLTNDIVSSEQLGPDFFLTSQQGHVAGTHQKLVCVEVLRPSQPNRVMSSAVSLSNHKFTGQA